MSANGTKRTIAALQQFVRYWTAASTDRRNTGVVVNYTPDRAVMFSLEGKALEILPRAYRVGKVRLSVGGRRVSPEVLNKIISGA